MTRRTGIRILASFLLIPNLPVHAQKAPRDLTGLSLEDLMNIEVTSVSKKDEKLPRKTSAARG
jgi:hypothetical protein